MINTVPLNAQAADAYRVAGCWTDPEPDVHRAAAGRKGERGLEQPAAAPTPVVGKSGSDFAHFERSTSGSAKEDRCVGWVHEERDSARTQSERAKRHSRRFGAARRDPAGARVMCIRASRGRGDEKRSGCQRDRESGVHRSAYVRVRPSVRQDTMTG